MLLVTLFAALFLGLQTAIYAGVLLSLMLFLNQAARPGIRDVKPDPHSETFLLDADTGLPDCPQLKMLRINGSIFFGAAEHIEEALQDIERATPTQKRVLIAASGINIVDISGAEMLAREARRRRKIGGGLHLHFVKDAVRDFLERGGYLQEIGPGNLHARAKTRSRRSIRNSIRRSAGPAPHGSSRSATARSRTARRGAPDPSGGGDSGDRPQG